jgi:hypothetical protein
MTNPMIANLTSLQRQIFFLNIVFKKFAKNLKPEDFKNEWKDYKMNSNNDMFTYEMFLEQWKGIMG